MSEAPEPVKIGEIKGLPLYLGTSVYSVEKLIEAGEDLFFIIGYEPYEHKGENNVVKKSARATIYEVRKNLVGFVIQPVSDTKIGVNQQLGVSSTIQLPKIPWELREKMSEFFHKVYKLHGTESILLLTYDETYLNSDDPGKGWGCIAPKQSNTSHDCHYEIDESVHAQKGETEFIVGSAHSHPNMSAYFSGTDHKDQVDFDGIHITYGWKGNGPDEYHIELYMAGNQFPYRPEDIFAQPPLPELEVEEEIDKWIEVVSKKAAVATTSSGTSWNGGHGYINTGTNFKAPTTSSQLGALVRTTRNLVIPPGCPSPSENTLIGTVSDEALSKDMLVNCILCNLPLVVNAIENMSCYGCGSFIALESENIDQFVDRFAERHKNIPEAIDPLKATKPIIFVWKNPENGTVGFGTDVRSAAAKKA